MKLLIFNYKCDNCKKRFETPDYPGEVYGEFLLRSKTGAIAYLNSFQSKEFDEISDLLDKVPYIRQLNKINQAKIFHKIFGVLCDRAEDGSILEIGTHPLCPFCGSQHMSSWGPVNPPRIVELPVKEITHERWNKLTYEDKVKELDISIKEKISSGEIIIEGLMH